MDYIFSLAFSLLIMLMIFDLLKEAIETFGFGKLYLFVIFALVGFLIFKLLDHFVPDHHDHLKNNKEVKENIHHIGLLSIIRPGVVSLIMNMDQLTGRRMHIKTRMIMLLNRQILFRWT